MSDLFEILLEFLVEGSIEAVGSKEVPLWARIALAAVLAAALIGLFALLICAGVGANRPGLLVLAGVGLSLCCVPAAVKIRRWRNIRLKKKGEER